MLFPKISAYVVHSRYPDRQFSPKNPHSVMILSSIYAVLYCLSICLILTIFRFVGANLHFRFYKTSAFWHTLLLNKLCQIFEQYLSKCALSLTYLLSRILPKYESCGFRQLKSENTIWNIPLHEMSLILWKTHSSSIYTRFKANEKYRGMFETQKVRRHDKFRKEWSQH